MCGITGWVEWKKDLTHFPSVLEAMTDTLAPRGPDASGTWATKHCALGHRRLSVIDPANGAQPMVREESGAVYVIVYNGELYNTSELRKDLMNRGYAFRTNCDTEVLLVAYIEWGAACVDKLNGIFAFAVWDDRRQELFMARDRLGVKPLFYTIRDDALLFASEPKTLLIHPYLQPEVGADGMAEIFALGPARTPGHGIYKQIRELRPGTILHFSPDGFRTRTYWRLEAREHNDDVETTAERIRETLIDTVHRQLVSDVPVCTLLSGGLDSSALTAIAAEYYNRNNLGVLRTFSVDYRDNDKHFTSTAFTPNPDAPWIKRMTEHLGTAHREVVIDTPELIESLRVVVTARDTPGMADIDGSLYLFCREIKKDATVALSGEAADEVFGGYPWFHREDALKADTFPWSLHLASRIDILDPEFADWIKPAEYVQERYREALDEVPLLDEEKRDPLKRRMREMSYLNITRFMPTLLDRKDRMSMAVGLEVRVPYCDHRLVEYVWNVPWEIKTAGEREKGILRRALHGVLPDEVLYRKKSPYPKTYNPSYLAAAKQWLLDILNDSASPLLRYVNKEKLLVIAGSDEERFNIPWFGQLMNMPQLFAYLCQVDYWLRTYRVTVK